MIDIKAGVPAVYRPSPDKRFRRNPFIECQPDIINEDKIFDLFCHIPKVEDSEREASPEVRIMMTEALKDYLIPMESYTTIALTINQMLFNGYIKRNPVDIGRPDLRRCRERANFRGVNSVNYPEHMARTGGTIPSTFLITGPSGVGKSTCLEKILSYFPQVIRHESYEGQNLSRTQINYLKVTCPFDGSIVGFCLDILREFDKALGYSIYEHTFDYTAFSQHRMIDTIGDLMDLYGVGLFLIDEVNFLLKNTKDTEMLCDLFDTIIDLWKVPVVFVGTPNSIHLLDESVHSIRRFSTEGHEFLDRMSFNDADWSVFINYIWPIQYTRNFTKLTDELSQALYEECQGIAALAVSIYRLTQQRVILDENNKNEVITPEMIHKTVSERFPKFIKLREAIKNNDIETMLSYGDLIVDLQNFSFRGFNNSETKESRIQKMERNLSKNSEEKNIMEISDFLRSQDFLTHLSLVDLETIALKTIKENKETKSINTLKRMAISKAVALESEIQDGILIHEEDLGSQNSLLDNNFNKKTSCEYLKLFEQAQRTKKSVYEVFQTFQLTGWLQL